MVISTLAMTVSDIILDLLSVFVFHGGLFGIGLASGLSYLVALLVGIGFFLRKDCLFKFKEGEGDRSLRYWREVHEDFFKIEMESINRKFEPEMKLVCEEFEVMCVP